MKLLKGLLVWPLLWFMRKFHIGDLSPEEITRRQQLAKVARMLQNKNVGDQIQLEEEP